MLLIELLAVIIVLKAEHLPWLDWVHVSRCYHHSLLRSLKIGAERRRLLRHVPLGDIPGTILSLFEWIAGEDLVAAVCKLAQLILVMILD